ncbi:MAG: ABC transporter ATP-binding protein [Planctomycetes bacterium]|nr:ABC transporter ATP-binding protein [Planctomycetota bacterium]
MSFLEIRSLAKVFPDGTRAVKGVDLQVQAGEFIVLLGPSGCGKTTTLRMIAGLERPSYGSVFLDGGDVTCLRPAQRDIGFVFQFYALYPHMTVRENLLFPLENTGVPPDQRENMVRTTARQMGIGSLLGRHPGRLSGGDQQKVSLARAMIREPRLWLMDEPLGTIDADRRIELREWVRERQLEARVTTLYVTHDQEEAMSLADRVVVMNDGEIDQVGSPTAVYDDPASLFTADFVGSPGMNLLDGEIRTGPAGSLFLPDGSHVEIPLAAAARAGRAVLGIRGEFVRPDENGPISGTVVMNEYQGSFRCIHLDIGSNGPIVMRTPPDCSFGLDDRVRASLIPEHVRLFDPGTGRRL